MTDGSGKVDLEEFFAYLDTVGWENVDFEGYSIIVTWSRDSPSGILQRSVGHITECEVMDRVGHFLLMVDCDPGEDLKLTFNPNRDSRVSGVVWEMESSSSSMDGYIRSLEVNESD